MAQRTNNAYGISQPIINVFPEPIRAKRAPTVNDKLDIGSLWIDQVNNQAYTLTSITDNQAHWSTLTILGVGVFNAVEATAGNITADVGDIIATLGNISSGGTITSGGALTVATGDLSILVGDLNVNTGNVIITTGNFRVTAGDIDTVAGDINSAGALTAGTTITAASNIVSNTGNITATVGDVEAITGNILAGGSIAAATGIATNAGGITATAGDITATAGNIVVTAGDITVPLGDLTVTVGTITGNTINCDTIVTSSSFVSLDLFNMAAALGGAFAIRGFNFAHIGFNFLKNNCYFGLISANQNDTTASFNTAVGNFSMQAIDNGATGNSSLGYETLISITSGKSNTAVGAESLASLTTTIRNTGCGFGTLSNLVSGSYNTALGYEAGANYETVESSNICIGNMGVLGENNTIRIGTDGAAPNQQNKCYIAGDVYAARSLNSTTGTFANSITVGSANILSGAGDPNGVVTATKGSLYLNLTGSGAADRAWINTNGGTAWTNLVTAA